MDPESLHAESIVIDSTCPLWHQLAATPPKYLDLCRAGGYTALAATIGGLEDSAAAWRVIGLWLRVIRESDDLMLVKSTADIVAAKKQGKLGIIFQFQGTAPLEDSLDLVDAYRGVGVRMIQLAYNTRNRFCDGSEEPNDAGLSRLGRRLVKRMNDAGVLVDVSHCSVRTSLQAIEASERTVVFSHANPKGVHDVPRNITDEQIRAIAANGGIMGILAYPPFVSKKPRPTIDDYIDHMDYVADLVGIDHIGVAPDYFHWQHPFVTDEQAMAQHRKRVAQGAWDPANYTPPPYYYPEGIETPDRMPNLTRRLLERGYKPHDVKKIMGENWIRVYRQVWGA